MSSYSDLGLTEALQYYLPHYFIDKEYSKAKTIIVFTWLMQIVSGVIISGGLYLGSDRLALHYFKTEQAGLLLKYFSLYFVILNLYQVI
jgi:Na+-driven multidrug efflux pump